MSAGRTQGVDTRTLAILAFSATAGTLVEIYDFFIYGYAAASAFPAIFFPKLPPAQALVFSFLAFGAGFPARLVAPGRRGYWWVKWVDRIEVQTTPSWWQPLFPTG